MTTWDEWELRQRGRAVRDAGVSRVDVWDRIRVYRMPPIIEGFSERYKAWWESLDPVERGVSVFPPYVRERHEVDRDPRGFRGMMEYLREKAPEHGLEVKEVAYWNDTFNPADLTYTYDPATDNDPATLDLAGKTITVHYPNGDTREVTFGDAVERDDDDEFTITLPVLRVEDE